MNALAQQNLAEGAEVLFAFCCEKAYSKGVCENTFSFVVGHFCVITGRGRERYTHTSMLRSRPEVQAHGNRAEKSMEKGIGDLSGARRRRSAFESQYHTSFVTQLFSYAHLNNLDKSLNQVL